MSPRLLNIIIFCAVIFSAPLRLFTQKKSSNTGTWAIINTTGNIGDMVCTTPVFRAIKKKYPQARVLVVGTEKNKLMMDGNPDIDRYITSTQSFFKLLKDLRTETIDYGIAVNLSTFEIGTLFLGGAKSFSCFTLPLIYKKHETRIYSILSKLGNCIRYTPGVYVPGQYLSLLKPYGVITTDVKKHLGYTPQGLASVDEQLGTVGILPEEPIVAISPGAGTKIKQWPAERFGHVANYISKKYNFGIAIIGGPRDEKEVAKMISACDENVRYCNCVNQSLDELKAVLSRAVLIIGNDSGPVYVAESFGAATLVLIGPTDETEHPLQDATHQIVMPRDRGKALLQSYISNEDMVNPVQARGQIEAITEDQVLEASDKLLQSLNYSQ
jgi:heptosyltransferase-2